MESWCTTGVVDRKHGWHERVCREGGWLAGLLDRDSGGAVVPQNLAQQRGAGSLVIAPGGPAGVAGTG